jgi:TolB protein
MARTNLDTDSPNVSTGIHGDGLLSLQFRRSQGGTTEEVKAPLVGADVIQLERKGSTYIMSVAQYGEPFVAVEVSDINLGDDIYVGLFICSHEDDIVERATFSDVRIVVPVKENWVYAETCGLILTFLCSGGRNAATIFSLRYSSSR